MRNIRPLQDYLDARDALQAGDVERAAAGLAQALGAGAPTTEIVENIDALFDQHSPAGALALDVLRGEISKRG